MKLNETFEDAVNYSMDRTTDGDFMAQFDLNPELDIEIDVHIIHMQKDLIGVNFHSYGSGKDIKDKGQITYKIFSTITQIIQEHVEEYDIQKISAIADSDKKADIYEKLLNRFGNKWRVYRRGRNIKAVKKYS
jgi:hypothetical protein